MPDGALLDERIWRYESRRSMGTLYSLSIGIWKDGYSDIPGYSTLIFNVNLVGISPLKGTERSVDDVLVAE